LSIFDFLTTKSARSPYGFKVVGLLLVCSEQLECYTTYLYVIVSKGLYDLKKT